jgi:dethiobiotin synthetase
VERNCELRAIFITGTDTGVGKTLLTALLLSHLRQSGCHALAMKPFCSGSATGLTDVEILYQVQGQELPTHEINPFFFPEPLAPLVAARRHHCRITLNDAIERIQSVISRVRRPSIHQSTNAIAKPNALPRQSEATEAPTRRHSGTPFLLIEGAGGLLAPLGEGFSNLDLIRKLRCETMVVSHNRLGAINHTLLTVGALRTRPKHRPEFRDHSSPLTSVVLMSPAHPDPSARSNPQILAEFLAPMPVFTLPFFGQNLLKKSEIQRLSKKYKKTLARILG